MNIRIQVMLTLCVRGHSSGCANEKQPLCIPISSQQDIKDEESARRVTRDEAAHFPGFTSGLRNVLFTLNILDSFIILAYCQGLIPNVVFFSLNPFKHWRAKEKVPATSL